MTTYTLKADDLPLMRQIIALFDEVFEEPPLAPAEDTWLTALLAGNRFVAVVALDDASAQRVVGAVTMHLLPNYRTGRNDGYVYDLGVAQSHRRQGIASALMRALSARAVEMGLGELWVQAESEEDWAVAFYESLGLEGDDVKHFEFSPEKLSKLL